RKKGKRLGVHARSCWPITSSLLEGDSRVDAGDRLRLAVVDEHRPAREDRGFLLVRKQGLDLYEQAGKFLHGRNAQEVLWKCLSRTLHCADRVKLCRAKVGHARALRGLGDITASTSGPAL